MSKKVFLPALRAAFRCFLYGATTGFLLPRIFRGSTRSCISLRSSISILVLAWTLPMGNATGKYSTVKRSMSRLVAASSPWEIPTKLEMLCLRVESVPCLIDPNECFWFTCQFRRERMDSLIATPTYMQLNPWGSPCPRVIKGAST